MKKEKKTKEQIEQEREARLDGAEKKLRHSIMSLEKSKTDFFNGMMEARSKGLKSQEQQYRATLSRCMAQLKMQEGALMELRLGRQSRDLVRAQREFVDCLDIIANDISTDTKKTNIKKGKKQMLRARFAVNQQMEKIDEALETGQYSDIADMESGKYSEFDSEIDSMIKDAGYNDFSTNSRDRNRY